MTSVFPEKAKVTALVNQRCLEIRDLDEITTEETFEEKEINIMFCSEQHWKNDLAPWHQDKFGRAGVQECNLKLRVDRYLEMSSGFVWVEVEDIRMYNRYFSPVH